MLRKTIVCCIVCLFGASLALHGSDQIYAVAHADFRAKRMFYSDEGIETQSARISLNNTGRVVGVLVVVDGPTDSGAVFVEVAVPKSKSSYLPETRNIVASGKGYKTSEGVEQIMVVLDSPVDVNSSDVFVNIRLSGKNNRLLSDNIEYQPICTDLSGEELWYQYLHFEDGAWRHGTHAFLVELLVQSSENRFDEWFTDVAAETGLGDIREVAELCWTDFDKDGYVDLLAGRNLWWNRDGQQFIMEKSLTGLLEGANMFVSLDADRNGYSDILVCSGPSSSLLINQGDGQFEHHHIHLPHLSNPVSYTLCDINADDFTDVAIVLESASATYKSKLVLLVNSGDGEFTFLEIMNGEQFSSISTVAWLDWNLDGTFELLASDLRSGLCELRIDYSAETAEADSKLFPLDKLDHSNRLAIFDACMIEPHQIRIAGVSSQGQLSFNDINTTAGLSESSRYGEDGPGEDYLAGVKLADFNNDGYLDQFVASASPCRSSLLCITGDERGRESQYVRLGSMFKGTSHDAVIVDFDNDGRLDICFDVDGRIALLKNIWNGAGSFSAVHVGSEFFTSDASGVRADFYGDGKIVSRCVQSGGGLLRQGPAYVHVGLGDRMELDSIVISRASGEKVVLDGPEPNKTLYLNSTNDRSESVSAIVPFHVGPNPATNHVNLSLEISDHSDVIIQVYDLEHKLVAELLNEEVTVGELSLQWSLQNQATDDKVAPGVYFVHVQVNDNVFVRKLIVNN